MKRFHTILSYALIALPGLAVATALTVPGQKAEKSVLEAVEAPVHESVPVRVVQSEGFLYENFESVPDGESALPEGWTATTTPGVDGDTWKAGTLGRDGTPLNGVSGYKYAYILGNRDVEKAHDAWLFSPGMQMTAGKEYTIEFFAMMPPVMNDDIMEKMQVCVMTAANASAVAKELEVIENDNDYWRYYSYTFTPATTGTYHIGFHSISPAHSNSTVIDDLKISSGPLPIYNGSAEVEMGTTDTRRKQFEATYRMANGGTAPLTVEVKSLPEGVTVEGLPATIAAEDDIKVNIKAQPQKGGDYRETLVLATNDPTLPEVKITLTGTVKEARLTGYVLEDFEEGGPEGWDLSFGAGNVAVYGGHNSSRAYYTTTMYASDERNAELDGVGFTTHYVNMGTSPVVSFWYQMAKVDFSGNVTGAAESSEVIVKVLLSDDDGKTYKPVYTIEPGGEHEFVSSLDWYQVTVPVPEYAGKTCRLRVVFNQPGGGSFFNQIRCMADDVEIGTKVQNDLRAMSLTGNALPRIGVKSDYTFTLQNLGAETMSDYKVELLDDNGVLQTVDGVPAEAGKNAEVALSWTPEKQGYTRLRARIVSASDPEEENNTSYAHHVQVLPDNNSAVSINHGEAVASMSFPINFYVVESATQSIFYANEIGATKGEINSLVFKSYLNADFYGEPFSVYIAETDRADFADNRMVDPESLTKVFEGSIYMQSGTRDLVIPFSTPYRYKGGNIVVMCQKLGKELVMGQYFVILKCPDVPRSIQASTYTAGTLVESGYEGAASTDVYPEIRFNIVKAESGAVSGVVSDSEGPVEGAKVLVKGTQRYEITDAQGRYSLKGVAAGQTTLEVSKHGYYTNSDNTMTITAGQTADCNITLRALPRHTVKGAITSAQTGQPIEGAKVQLLGYDDFSTFTDASGRYEIPGVAGDTKLEYTLKVTDSYFKPKTSTLDVNADKTTDFSLDEKLLRAHNANVTSTSEGALLTWNRPMPEFRYDSGDPVDYIGWTHGNSEVIVGTAFYEKARIKEISWYVTDKYGAHSNFNVFVFGLDKEGNPNPKDILYVARNVDFNENAWSTHILGTPVEADRYMIAVSCDGFMGIGICNPTGEYPFEDGQCFYAGDSYNMHISKMSTFAEAHLMLRAYGDDLDNSTAAVEADDKESITRPAHKYKVYRAKNGAPQDEWVSLGTTESTDWVDRNVPSTDSYFYAVVASYATGDANEVRTKVIKLSSVDTVFGTAVTVGPNPVGDELRITGTEEVAAITLVSSAGATVLHTVSPSESIDVSGLPAGVYVAIIKMTDGSDHTVRLIKK